MSGTALPCSAREPRQVYLHTHPRPACTNTPAESEGARGGNALSSIPSKQLSARGKKKKKKSKSSAAPGAGGATGEPGNVAAPASWGFVKRSAGPRAPLVPRVICSQSSGGVRALRPAHLGAAARPRPRLRTASLAFLRAPLPQPPHTRTHTNRARGGG